jgi:leucyl/phenylalanyl-tRNA---protein transferase
VAGAATVTERHDPVVRPPLAGDEPMEPPPTACAFPPAEAADESGVVGVGGDLEPGTLLTAYRNGLFPMPLGRHGPMGWWSPEPRAILPLDGLQVSRSLRRSLRRYEVRVDTAFGDVIDACADPTRPDGWISAEVRDAYVRLHELGWAHSVEAWDADGGRLVGGLYGVAIGGLFAGESMFHRATDASKVALVGLVELLREPGTGPFTSGGPVATATTAAPTAGDGCVTAGGAMATTRGRLLDVQWATPHLLSLGAREVSRRTYLDLVRKAVRLPLPRGLRWAAGRERRVGGAPTSRRSMST